MFHVEHDFFCKCSTWNNMQRDLSEAVAVFTTLVLTGKSHRKEECHKKAERFFGIDAAFRRSRLAVELGSDTLRATSLPEVFPRWNQDSNSGMEALKIKSLRHHSDCFLLILTPKVGTYH